MSEPNYPLVIGDKNLSSWSLRPWLANTILCHSPSGKVPTLKADGLVVCYSLAILEFLGERHPELALWPRDREARALARSISAEMHSGFVTLRNEMSMDLLARLPTPPIGEALESDITRIVAIWRDARARHGGIGPFLFSAFSNADAMFAPVAARFRTYGLDLAAFGDEGLAADYARTMLALPEMAEWTKGAETEVRERAKRLTLSFPPVRWRIG